MAATTTSRLRLRVRDIGRIATTNASRARLVERRSTLGARACVCVC
jgi:hypothetical protein